MRLTSSTSKRAYRDAAGTSSMIRSNGARPAAVLAIVPPVLMILTRGSALALAIRSSSLLPPTRIAGRAGQVDARRVAAQQVRRPELVDRYKQRLTSPLAQRQQRLDQRQAAGEGRPLCLGADLPDLAVVGANQDAAARPAGRGERHHIRRRGRVRRVAPRAPGAAAVGTLVDHRLRPLRIVVG